MKRYINILSSIVIASLFFTSCESLLDVDPEEVVLADDFLGDDSIDTRSALFGILSQMQDITGQLIVLGELRGDLVDITASSVDELRQINSHNISDDNSYVDPLVLFSMINNCNFALDGIDTEANSNELLDDYASILRLRTWAQLQILINYGELPYITQPIRSDDDLIKSYPLLSFNEALDQLIQNLQEVTGIDNVTKYENSLGFNIFNMIPDQDILLGDLHLWRGNYVSSATYYKTFLDDNVSAGGTAYNLTSQYGVTATLNGGTYNFVSRWFNIFNETILTAEVINYVAFDDQYRQPNGSFSILTEQIKPSESLLLNWLEQSKSFEGNPVDIEDTRSWLQRNTEVIHKYQYDYFAWYRVAKVYLRYAEAVNYAGYPEHALTIVNGIFNNPDVAPDDALIFDENNEAFLSFDKDQYYVTNSGGTPTGGNLGVRGRVSMAPVNVDENATELEKIQTAGAHILNEAALELAFEGNRWEDLLRFSRRANDPSIIANAVSGKFETAGDLSAAADVNNKLLNPDNWYLPLEIPDNFISQ